MYVYKLASHDKCQYAILNKEQKGITDSRRVSSPPLTCTDAPPYTHAHTHVHNKLFFIILYHNFSFFFSLQVSPPRVSLSCSVERRSC